MGPYPSRVAVLPRVSASQRSASEVGIFTPFGLVSTRGITVFVPGCWRRRCMKGFMILGWDLIFLGWRWLHEHHPINNQSVEFSHRSEGYCIDPGDHCFRLRFVRVVDVWKDL